MQPAGVSKSLTRSARLYALECLTRGPLGTELESADQLFGRVRRDRIEVVADCLCVANALGEASHLEGAPRLSINVHAATLCQDAEFPSFLFRTAQQHGISLGGLLLEIVEYAPSLQGKHFMKAIADVREKGFGIALDDIGAGHSNYRRILDCRPDYFKIDRYFVHGANGDQYRRAVLESIAELGRKVGAKVIAEGVEDMQDLGTLAEVGIDLAQGFLFSRPLHSTQLLESPFLAGESLTPQEADQRSG